MRANRKRPCVRMCRVILASENMRKGRRRRFEKDKTASGRGNVTGWTRKCPKKEIVYVIRKKIEYVGNRRRRGGGPTEARTLASGAVAIYLVLPAAQTLFVAYPSRRYNARRSAS